MYKRQILNKSNDGFYIASEALKLRGPGDFFGIRQSGDLAFALADVYQDSDVLTVSYTHLDVYKRQDHDRSGKHACFTASHVHDCRCNLQ